MIRHPAFYRFFNIDGNVSSTVLIFVLIFANIVTCSKFFCFKNSSDNDKPLLGESSKGWQQWRRPDHTPFYINHIKKKAQLEDPREVSEKAGCVTKIPYPKTIDDKIKLFYQQLDEPQRIGETRDFDGKFPIRVNRSNNLRDSYDAVMHCEKVGYLKQMLRVEFYNEKSVDTEENLAREWLWVLSSEISDPKNGFFQYVDEDNYELEINPNWRNLSDFKFIGRVIGMAVYHKIFVNVCFVKPYYQTILNHPIQLEDVKTADPIYYKNLSTADKTSLKQRLSHSEAKKCKNKTELISKIIHERYATRVQDQMTEFLAGFADLIPLHLLSIFTADELKLLIGGLQTIDVEDWQENTEYDENSDRDSQTVQWFWNIVLAFTDEQRRRLLQFVVGTPRLPANGFKDLSPMFHISILIYEDEINRIPSASLCFNKIKLSSYTSEEVMRQKMEEVINIHHTIELA